MLTRVQDVEVTGSVVITEDLVFPPREGHDEETEDASVRQAFRDAASVAARVAALESRNAALESRLTDAETAIASSLGR